MDEWQREMLAWDRAEKMANVDHYITAKNNPLLGLGPRRTPAYEHNMATLRRDRDMREAPVTGKIYTGLMDNMRYGGNE